MGFTLSDEHGVAGRQLVESAVLRTQDGGADGEEVEVGVSWFGSKTQPERGAGLDATVLDAPQAHAAQQFVDEIGR